MAAWIARQALTGGVDANHMAIAAADRCPRRVLYYVYRATTNLNFRQSFDDGATWTPAVTIATCDEVPLDEALSAEDRYLHVVYSRALTLYYRRSTDFGLTWSSEVTIDTTTTGRIFRVSIIADNGYVHLAWTTDHSVDPSDGPWYKRSTDGGVTWGSNTRIYSTSVQGSRPFMEADGNYLHLVFIDGATGNVNYGRSTDRGANWEAKVAFTTSGTTLRPTVAADYGNVVAVWQDPIGTEDLYIKRSSDNGSTWTSNAVLVSQTNEQEHAFLVMREKIVAMAWQDRRSGTQKGYMMLSRDAGVNWETEEQLDTAAAAQFAPRIVLGSTHIGVVQQNSGDQGYIYRRAITPTPPSYATLDNFNRADENPIGSPWISESPNTSNDGLRITTNTLRHSGSANFRSGSRRIDSKWKRYDLAEIGVTITTVGSTGEIDLYLYSLFNPSAAYSAVVDKTSNTVAINGVATTSLSAAASDGDKYAFQRDEEDLVLWRYRSAVWTELLRVYDATYKEEFTPSIEIGGNTAGWVLDDFGTNIPLYTKPSYAKHPRLPLRKSILA